MTKNEGMWVGVRLLGLYFLVLAIVESASVVNSFYLMMSDQTGTIAAEMYMRSAILYFAIAAIYLIAGVLFFCCTGMIVNRPDSKNFPHGVDNSGLEG